MDGTYNPMDIRMSSIAASKLAIGGGVASNTPAIPYPFDYKLSSSAISGCVTPSTPATPAMCHPAQPRPIFGQTPLFPEHLPARPRF
jgi:hypothetical protein